MMSDDMLYIDTHITYSYSADLCMCVCEKDWKGTCMHYCSCWYGSPTKSSWKCCGRLDELEQPRPLKPLPFQAKATVAVGGGPAQVDGKPVLDKRPKSNLDDNDVKVLDFRLMSPRKPKQLPERLNTNELMSWYIFFLHVCCFLVMMHKGFLKFSRWERQVDLVRHTRSQVKKKNPYRKPNESSSLCVLVRAGKLHKQFSWKFSYRIRLLSSPKSPDLFVYTWFHLTKTQVSMRSGSQTCRRGSFCSRGL